MSHKNGSTTDTHSDVERTGANVSSANSKDRSRRHFLALATAVLGVVGAAVAALPFIASLRPSARARARGEPVTVDVNRILPGEEMTVIWRGKPVWIMRRTPDMLERMNHPHWLKELRDPDSSVATQQPPYAQNSTRSIRPDIFVGVALCTHLGCVPLFRPEAGSDGLGEDWMGGYFCPCHGSKFDLAGRVTKGVPAPTNLVIPPHRYLTSGQLEIGVDHV